MSGLRLGLRFLGICLAVSLFAFAVAVLIASPLRNDPGFVLEGLLAYAGDRLFTLPGSHALATPDWYVLWTGYYAVWWFALAPITALFVLCISRGRSLTAMLLATLFVGGGSALVWTSIMSGTSLLRETATNDFASAVLLDVPRAAHQMLAVLGAVTANDMLVLATLGSLLFVAKLASTLHALGWWSFRSQTFPPALVTAALAALCLLGILFFDSRRRLDVVESLVTLIAPLTALALCAGLTAFIWSVVKLLRNPPQE